MTRSRCFVHRSDAVLCSRAVLVVEVHAMSAAALLERGRELFAMAHQEAGLPGPLVVNDQVFLAMDKAGVLIVLGAFEDQELVGYAVAAVGPELFADTIGCSVLSVFVKRPGNGRKLMNAMVHAAHQRGAERVFWRAQRGTALERLLIHRGARAAETVYEEAQTEEDLWD